MTIEQARRKGFWMIRAPSTFVLVAPMLVCIVLVNLGYLPQYGYEGMKWFLSTFSCSFVIAWLIWSVQAPRWKISVFPVVENLGELKRRAIAEKLMWPSGHLFERTEICSPTVRSEIRRIEAERQSKCCSAS